MRKIIYKDRIITVEQNVNGKSFDIRVNGGVSNWKIPLSKVENNIDKIKRFIDFYPTAYTGE